MSHGRSAFSSTRLPGRRLRGFPPLASALLWLTVCGVAAPVATAAAHSSARGRGAPPAAHAQPPPSAQTVLFVQRLFRDLGYPLGAERPGELGVASRGALRYFQRKYGLEPTGYPDAATISRMLAVEASLQASDDAGSAPTDAASGTASSPQAAASGARVAPKDLIERLLDRDLPLLGIAVVLAAVLGLWALGAPWRSRYSARP